VRAVTLLIAVFTWVWIIHRSLIQSITLDEAITYLHWVRPDGLAFLTPHSNNHILNSMLMKLSDWCFGPSHLSLRLPALIGGTIYIYAAYNLTRRLTPRPLLQSTLLICFLWNPFCMDYMVAARGYGLALGFLTLSLATLAKTLQTPAPPIPTAALFSICAALAFSANFSWAYATAFLWLLSISWLLSQSQTITYKLLAAATIPGAILVTAICGYVLLHYPKDQLFWGTDSLLKTILELDLASFALINLQWVPPKTAALLNAAHQIFILVIPSFLLFYFFFNQRDWRLNFSVTVVALLFLTTLAHWLQFRYLKIPLPFERTSLFAIPILTALFGTALTSFEGTGFKRVLRTSAAILLCLVATYFTSTLHDTYFREWSINADIRSAYPIIEDYCRRTGTRKVISDLNYTPSLNVYRIFCDSKYIDELANFEKPPEGQSIYVLPADSSQSFIQSQNLKPIFRGSLSDFSVLVR